MVKITTKIEKFYTSDGKCTRFNEYEKLHILHEGNYAMIRLAQHINNKQMYVLKIYKKTRIHRIKQYRRIGQQMERINLWEMIKSEIEIIKDLYNNGDGKQLVPLTELMYNDDMIIYVSEYFELGPCMQYKEKDRTFSHKEAFREDRIKNYIYDIIKGIAYMHAHHIAHRDLKPENILLSKDGHCYLNDFDSAIKTSNGMVTDTVGTYEFFPPEAIGNYEDIDRVAYDVFKADIWALGVCLYIFFYGKLPFDSIVSTYEIFKKICNEKLELPEEPKISEEGTCFLVRLLVKDPNQRITIQEIYEHPWLKGVVI